MVAAKSYADISGRNLMVNFLPPDMSEIELQEIFQKCGSVDSVRIITSKQTNRRSGYGFVVMVTNDGSELAIRNLNGWSIRNKRLKVTFAQADMITRTNVYVAGLPKGYSENELIALFSKFGDILEAKVLLDPNGGFRGAGFVRFAKHAMATVAINTMSGYMLIGYDRPLTVRYANGPSRMVNSGLNKQNFGTNGMKNIRDSQCGFLGYHINEFGYNNLGLMENMIGSYEASMSMESIGNRGFMKVNENISDINTNRTPVISSNPAGVIGAGRLMGKGKNEDSAYTGTSHHIEGIVLFVYNLSPQMDRRKLEDLFLPFGTVLATSIRQGKGYGFITMTNNIDAHEAINQLNGITIQGKALQVSVKH